ncbi:SDR family NAD(P)-dependent oxidoreductase [Amycolatopsis sp. FDAARGOS 1241]|uniref:SDR family NAD(P)-dependent oxidoreductase n=1 Tax=Amycolatopsis sp. FDAARGOS 1241 TaxID=2778070 RepID=UPI00194E29E5|nr:SDR family oxidoreductase [Amycolatopsis sp. FDAARGOS 1241]QRP44855.1 SDR family oxidoreductase [Amycolatopsis sp. FDAARGOS 1241]
MLLEGKNAVVYGGGGAIGGAIARAFAEEGARVFLAGRTRARLEKVADDIRAAGGRAEVAELDALDEQAVDAHADAVVAAGGSLDVSVNVISHGDVQGTPLLEMSLADYEQPVVTAVRTTFLTARAAGRHMKRQGSGVILVFGGDGDPVREHSVGGLQVAFHALEAMRRQLAAELGRYGVRTVTLRTGGVPETLPSDFPAAEQLSAELAKSTMLGRTATLADVGAVAAFVASDRARTMTAATANISCGALVD